MSIREKYGRYSLFVLIFVLGIAIFVKVVPFLGGLLGACLACGVLVVRYLMNDTFVTPDDVAKYLGVQPLAVIPEGDLGDFNAHKKRKLFERRDTK